MSNNRHMLVKAPSAMRMHWKRVSTGFRRGQLHPCIRSCRPTHGPRPIQSTLYRLPLSGRYSIHTTNRVGWRESSGFLQLALKHEKNRSLTRSWVQVQCIFFEVQSLSERVSGTFDDLALEHANSAGSRLRLPIGRRELHQLKSLKGRFLLIRRHAHTRAITLPAYDHL